MYSGRPYSSVPYSSVGLPPEQTPFVPPVWENPRGPQWPIELRTFVDWFNLPMQQTLPPRQTDWPVPNGPLRARDYTWTWSLTTQGIVLPPSPFNQFDWPVPKGLAPATWLLTWTDSFKLPLQQNMPENQFDWPNPRGPQYPIENRTDIKFSLPITPPAPLAALPFLAAFGLPPAGRRPSVDLLTWTWSTLRYIGQDRPQRQRDWPNPVRRKRDANRYILTDTPTKPQYPPREATAPLQVLYRLEPRVRYLKNEVGRVRFLAKTVVE